MASAHPSAARIPRVTVLGLRCGASASFLASRRLASADVLEPDAEVVRAGRDFFRLDFDEIDWEEVKDDPTRVEALVASAPAPGRFRVWTGCRDPGAFFYAAKRVWERTKRETTEDQALFAGAIGDLPDAADHRAAALLRGLVRSGAVGIAALAARTRRRRRGARAFFAPATHGRRSGAGVDVVVACDPDERTFISRGGEAVDEFAGLRGRGGVVLAGRSGAGDSDPSTPLLGALLDPSTANPALAALRLPFEVETWAPARGLGSRVRMASFRAADEDEDGAPRLVDERKDAANDAWGVFGDEATETDAGPRSASAADATNRVFTAATAATVGGETETAAAKTTNAKRKRPRDARAFWTEALGGLACDGGEQGPRDEKKDDAGKKKEAEEDLAGFEVGGGGAADSDGVEAARVAESVRAAGYVAGTPRGSRVGGGGARARDRGVRARVAARVRVHERPRVARGRPAVAPRRGRARGPPFRPALGILLRRGSPRALPRGVRAETAGRPRSSGWGEEAIRREQLRRAAPRLRDARGVSGGPPRRRTPARAERVGAARRRDDDERVRVRRPAGRRARGEGRGGRDERTNGRRRNGRTAEDGRRFGRRRREQKRRRRRLARAVATFDRAAATPLAPLRAGSFSAWAGDVVHWGTACEGGPRGDAAGVARVRVSPRGRARATRGGGAAPGGVRGRGALAAEARGARGARADVLRARYGETGAKRREIAETVEEGGGEEGVARRRG